MLNTDIRVDLHIHSKASGYKEGLDSSGVNIVAESDVQHLDILFDKLSLPENKINLISITDHNRIDIDLYREVNRRIADGNSGTVQAVLTGVEFDVEFQESLPHCHVVTIFNTAAWNNDCPDWERDYKRIYDAIEDNKISEVNGKYTLEEYEAILKKIGLDVILIAHQHQGPENTNVKKRSLFSSTDEASELVKFRYIDALEYTKSRIQGIVLSDLVELGITASTIVGSDCHTWSVYPRHDQDASFRDSYYSTIRALPTFKGLLMALTSPDSRFQQSARRDKAAYINRITVNGTEIELCPGINAIIGENGAGKSSLLAMMTMPPARLEKHIRKLSEQNEVKIPKLLDGDKTIRIKQNELEERYWKNGGMFEQSLYPSIDNSLFNRRVHNWSDAVKSRLNFNIREASTKEKLKNTSFRFNFDLESETYYIHIAEPEDFTGTSNPHEAHLRKIINARDILKEEIKTGYYKNGTLERQEMDAAIAALKKLVRLLSAKNEDAKLVADTRNAISREIAQYEEEIKSKETDKDTEKRNYRGPKNAVRDIVLKAISDACTEVPAVPDLSTLPYKTGTAERSAQGFKFVTVAKYADEASIAGAFLAQNMNSGYKSIDELFEIATTEQLETAIPSHKAGDWETRWDLLIDGFIDSQEETARFIKGNNDSRIGSTLGEQSLTYYEYCSYRGTDIDVFVIDQPEDHISNARISEQLVTFFNRMRKDKQIIIVTHSPLLVVNQDVDNVICLETQNGKMAVSSGCLESGDILDNIAKQMEGGTEAVKRRLRVYGETV